jgi:putative nucleotidyltransferase with HDIG domain
MSQQPDILALWPELDWIENDALRAATARAWELALERSPLSGADLQRIPFTLLHATPVTFMAHKRCVVHIARESARAMQAFMGDHLPIDLDVVVAGAILADVGKLLEYEPDPAGGSRQSARGKYLRHPFTGVALCMEAGVPDAVSHIVATHAAEGNLVTRSVEACIVHHADFMSYDPVAKRLQV